MSGWLLIVILLLKILIEFLLLGSENLQRKDLEELGLGMGGAVGNWMWRERKAGEKPSTDLINSSSESWPRWFCICGEMVECSG